MLEILKNIQKRWENELKQKYKGELEIDYIDGTGFVAVAFNNSPTDNFDSSITELKEIPIISLSISDGNEIISSCKQLKIETCW